MAQYSTTSYAASKYGGTVRLALSARPVVATAIGGGKVFVRWTSPSGGYYGIRLVRSQTGYPETFQDGVTLWEELSDTPSRASFVEEYSLISPSRVNFTDGYNNLIDTESNNDVPLIPGSYAFYRIFLLTETGGWKPAGDTSVLIPSVHDSTLRILEYLPRVFTGADGDVTSPVALDTELAAFVDGFGFTMDEWLTEADLLYSDASGKKLPPNLLPSYELSKGLPVEPNLPFRSRKRLIREANYIYQHKGTKAGLERFVESMTQWNPTIGGTGNLLFDSTDSSFEHPIGSSYADDETQVGRWVGSARADITLDLSGTATEDPNDLYAFPTTATNLRCAKVHVHGSSSTPVVELDCYIPIDPAENFRFSASWKSGTTGYVYYRIDWYTATKSHISQDRHQTLVLAGDWQRLWSTPAAPSNAAFARLSFEFATNGDYYLDLIALQYFGVYYTEPNAVVVTLDAANYNAVQNPSFEDSATDRWRYTDCTATQYSNIHVQGTKSAKVVATGDWTAEPIYSNSSQYLGDWAGGSYLTASAYIAMDEGADLSATLRITARSADGDTIVESFETKALTKDGERFVATIYIPTDSPMLDDGYAYVGVAIEGGAGTFYIDAVQVEPQAGASEYFDGSVPSVASSYVWAGTAHASTSGYYPNRAIKIPRLIANLPNYLPPGTAFTVRSMAGVETAL